MSYCMRRDQLITDGGREIAIAIAVYGDRYWRSLLATGAGIRRSLLAIAISYRRIPAPVANSDRRIPGV